MREHAQEKIYSFFEKVVDNIQNGMSHLDAIDLAAVTIGDFIPSIVSQATSKYQEATNEKMKLFHEENVDELAIATMDKLWHDEVYDTEAQITLEDILAQSVYFILKYAKEENALEAALRANEKTAGNSEAREVGIKMVLS
jgi:uncharacterized protein YdaT